MVTNSTWHKIATSIDEIDFNGKGLAEMDINGKTICVARHNEKIFACTQKCPHAGAPLADGYLDALGNLVCPLHKYKFSLKNGRNISGEGYYLKTYPLSENSDGLYIFLPDVGF